MANSKKWNHKLFPNVVKQILREASSVGEPGSSERLRAINKANYKIENLFPQYFRSDRKKVKNSIDKIELD